MPWVGPCRLVNLREQAGEWPMVAEWMDLGVWEAWCPRGAKCIRWASLLLWHVWSREVEKVFSNNTHPDLGVCEEAV